MSRGDGRMQRWLRDVLNEDQRPPWERWEPVVDLSIRYANAHGRATGRAVEEGMRRAAKRLAVVGAAEQTHFYLKRNCRERGVRTPTGQWFRAMKPWRYMGQEEYANVQQTRRLLVCRRLNTIEEAKAERVHYLKEEIAWLKPNIKDLRASKENWLKGLADERQAQLDAAMAELNVLRGKASAHT